MRNRHHPLFLGALYALAVAFLTHHQGVLAFATHNPYVHCYPHPDGDGRTICLGERTTYSPSPVLPLPTPEDPDPDFIMVGGWTYIYKFVQGLPEGAMMDSALQVGETVQTRLEDDRVTCQITVGGNACQSCTFCGFGGRDANNEVQSLRFSADCSNLENGRDMTECTDNLPFYLPVDYESVPLATDVPSMPTTVPTPSMTYSPPTEAPTVAPTGAPTMDGPFGLPTPEPTDGPPTWVPSNTQDTPTVAPSTWTPSNNEEDPTTPPTPSGTEAPPTNNEDSPTAAPTVAPSTWTPSNNEEDPTTPPTPSGTEAPPPEAPTTIKTYNIKSKLDITFFAGTGQEPTQLELEALLLTAQDYFTSWLATSLPESDFESLEFRLKSSQYDDDSDKVTVNFATVVTLPQESSVTPYEVSVLMTEVDFQELIIDYLRQTDLGTDESVFDHTFKVVFQAMGSMSNY